MYYSNKNLSASLLITIIFFVTSIILNKYFILEQFIRYRPGPPVKNQHVTPDRIKYYPLFEDKIRLPDEKVFQCEHTGNHDNKMKNMLAKYFIPPKPLALR